MILPKIEYNPGTGTVDFVPTYPPTDKEPGVSALDFQGGELQAERHDSIASVGYIQMVTERIDTFLNLTFPFVPASDMANWVPFMQFALAGGVFNYYLDSTLPDFTEYTMESTDWKTKRVAPGIFSFTLKLRQLYPTTGYFS